MPKLVDHVERRRAIIAATWRLIAARGIEGANMRDIAAEAGYTNGALSHYFTGKDEILRTAFEHIFDATNRRIDDAIGDATGLDALRVFCREIMPTTDETLLEARIAVSLWHRAMYDESMESVNRNFMRLWRDRMAGFLCQAQTDGDASDFDISLAVEQLLNMMMGMQTLGVLTPDDTSAARQFEMVEHFISKL